MRFWCDGAPDTLSLCSACPRIRLAMMGRMRVASDADPRGRRVPARWGRMRRPRMLPSAVALMLVVTALALGVNVRGGGDAGECAVPGDARFVSPRGSDSSPGTVSRPWRTIEKAETEAGPSTTVALRGGSYGTSGEIISLEADGRSDAPISIVAYPGETPSIAGHVAVYGDHRRLCGLVLDGATGPVARPSSGNPDREQVKLLVSGDGFELSSSEVSGSRWHAGIYLSGAEEARIVDNYIHDNGRFGDPSQANLDHGLYWSSGSGLIEGNRFEDNYAHAVQLYPDADGVTVRRNAMTGHGRSAVMVAKQVADSVIEDNQIFGNRKGIEAWSLSGEGNVARDNRLWDNRDGDLVGHGLALSGNYSLRRVYERLQSVEADRAVAPR